MNFQLPFNGVLQRFWTNSGSKYDTSFSKFSPVIGLFINSLTNDIYLGSFYRQVGLNVSAPLDAHFGMMFILKQVPAVAALAYRKTKQQDGGVRRSIF